MALPGSVRARGRTDQEWLFGAFTATLALALILDQLWWGGFEVASWRAVVVLVALVVLARPRAVAGLVALLAVEVVAVAHDLPVVGTHRLLLLIVAGTVLVQLL